ncbi:MAG: hypothetical protein ABH863_06370 [Candidatus Micrarchaeota archaeon]
MLPIGKFLEPNWGKIVAFVGIMIIVFQLAYPEFKEPCYYSDIRKCGFGEVSCISSPYESLFVCERNKALFSVGFTVAAYLVSCLFFLAYKLLNNEAYSYYYEQT